MRGGKLKEAYPRILEEKLRWAKRKKFLNFPGDEIYEIHDLVLHVGLGLNVSDVHHLSPVPSTEQTEKERITVINFKLHILLFDIIDSDRQISTCLYLPCLSFVQTTKKYEVTGCLLKSVSDV